VKLIEGFAKTTHIHVMAAITATSNPGHKIFNTKSLGKQLKKVIWQQDEDGKTHFSFLE
jgi:hypothetical protein